MTSIFTWWMLSMKPGVEQRLTMVSLVSGMMKYGTPLMQPITEPRGHSVTRLQVQVVVMVQVQVMVQLQVMLHAGHAGHL